MFRFEDLPEELKVKVLKHFFEDTDDAEPPLTHDDELDRSMKEYTIQIPPSSTNGSIFDDVTPPLKTGSWSKSIPYFILTVRPHHTFPALFASRSFLLSALPVYTRSISLEISCIRECFLPSPKPLRPNLLNETVLTLLSQARTLKAPTDQSTLLAKCITYFRTTVPSLQTLIFRDPNILFWSRFVRVASNGMSPQIAVDDIFQSPEIVTICHPNSRRVLSESELRCLKSKEMIFPGDLKSLCRYIKSVAEYGHPREIQRVVTIGCYASLSWTGLRPSELFFDATRRKIVINLSIDVRALAILAVDVRDEEWAEG